jgi:hypothetical protein
MQAKGGNLRESDENTVAGARSEMISLAIDDSCAACIRSPETEAKASRIERAGSAILESPRRVYPPLYHTSPTKDEI